MSPARSKRTAIPHRRSRAEIVRAGCVSAGIVVVTALVIWLMRPGPAGTAGTGGYMNRQPRSSAVVIGALLLGGAATWIILKGKRRTRGRAKVLVPVALGVALIVAVVVGFAWPGGLLRHDIAPPKPQPTPTTIAATTSTGAASTTGASSTTGATSTTGISTSTTTPTTGTATTTSP